EDGDDHAGDAGLGEGARARAGAAGVAAGLERDDGGAATGPGPGVGERHNLRVRLAGPGMKSLTGDPSLGVEDDAPDDGVRAGTAEPTGGELDGARHRLLEV